MSPLPSSHLISPIAITFIYFFFSCHHHIRATRFLFYLPCIHGSFSHHMPRSSVTYHAMQDIWGQRVRILGKRINEVRARRACMSGYHYITYEFCTCHVSCVMRHVWSRTI